MTAGQDEQRHYYLVRKKSFFNIAIRDYDKRCTQFAACAEKLAKRYGADSVVIKDVPDTIIHAFNFAEKKAPENWDMFGSGSFCPPDGSSEWDNIQKARLKHFGTYFGNRMKFAVLENEVILSLPAAPSGRPYAVEFADPIDKSTVDTLKMLMSEKDMKRIDLIEAERWKPAPFVESGIFRPSDEVRKLNERRLQAWSAGKPMPR
ncbi:MAG: hypothetical protein PHE27_06020 [Alphaproteobacteria bacterium]|nr:hypothetical protein [Alphaproteobacteria bacterium]